MSTAFAPRPGCPLCSIVSSASAGDSTEYKLLWRDETLTAYVEQAHPVSSRGHIIIAINLHVPSIYTLSSTDLPLLVNIRNLAQRLLSSLISNSTHTDPQNQFHIGFINPPFKDNKIPVTDHLHCHGYIGPGDLMGWWRGIAYSSLAWYSIDDLIAEIRESVSNNRVKSGYQNRNAAIDRVPQAGARSGTADGRETTAPAILHPEANLEGGEGTPSSPCFSPSPLRTEA
ncbi:histidine triad family protein [Moniliophthora roreri]|uniref:HIT domain-containing protein n=1 Tax=Moniliophthora roreri TaxID=221103 RepID=A0A0W0FXZ4_MONRR|nr:histidine triad family protein [Moniliophthora roreri]